MTVTPRNGNGRRRDRRTMTVEEADMVHEIIPFPAGPVAAIEVRYRTDADGRSVEPIPPDIASYIRAAVIRWKERLGP